MLWILCCLWNNSPWEVAHFRSGGCGRRRGHNHVPYLRGCRWELGLARRAPWRAERKGKIKKHIPIANYLISMYIPHGLQANTIQKDIFVFQSLWSYSSLVVSSEFQRKNRCDYNWQTEKWFHGRSSSNRRDLVCFLLGFCEVNHLLI